MKLMLAEDEPGLSRALTAILQHSDYVLSQMQK